MVLAKCKGIVIFCPSCSTGYLSNKYYRKIEQDYGTNISYSRMAYVCDVYYEIRAWHGIPNRIEIFQSINGINGARICL